jgi:hypothetical protein
MINKSAKSVLFEINPQQDTKKYYNLSGILVIVDNIELRVLRSTPNNLIKSIRLK